MIRYGKGVSSKPNIPKELYKKYSKAEENAEEYVMPTECQAYIEFAVDNVNHYLYEVPVSNTYVFFTLFSRALLKTLKKTLGAFLFQQCHVLTCQ